MREGFTLCNNNTSSGGVTTAPFGPLKDSHVYIDRPRVFLFFLLCFQTLLRPRTLADIPLPSLCAVFQCVLRVRVVRFTSALYESTRYPVAYMSCTGRGSPRV